MIGKKRRQKHQQMIERLEKEAEAKNALEQWKPPESIDASCRYKLFKSVWAVTDHEMFGMRNDWAVRECYAKMVLCSLTNLRCTYFSSDCRQCIEPVVIKVK